MQERIEYYKTKLSQKEALLQFVDVHGKLNPYHLTETIDILKEIIADLEKLVKVNDN